MYEYNFHNSGLTDFARALRSDETTCEKTTRLILSQIEQQEPQIGAFEHIAGKSALETAKGLDLLLKSGVDLGPLMGVPIAVKDLFAVEGMPTTAGSNVDVIDLIGPEGGFIQSLRQAGCVLIGKTKTIEFAFGGASGINHIRGTPRNPLDTGTHRGCGGSSSGSAAALAAGMCAFSIGSDTGGSVRIPAAFCGLVGYKPTTGLWPTDGIFPLCKTLDTVGLLTRTVADAQVIYSALKDAGNTIDWDAKPISSMRFGLPINQFVDDLDPEVANAFEAAIARLRSAGAKIIDVEVPNLGPPEDFFHMIVPSEFIASVGRERFAAMRDKLGPDIAIRADAGLDVTSDAYICALRRQAKLADLAHRAIQGFDGWLTPTIGIVAPAVSELDDTQTALALNARIGHFTRPVNLYDFCSLSLPIPSKSLPVGLQIMAPRGYDKELLATADAVAGTLV